MAKASEAKVPVSARISADLADEVDAAVKRSGRSKTDVIEELIRLGLAAQKGQAEPDEADGPALDRVLAAIGELSGSLVPAKVEKAVSVTELGEELSQQNERLAEMLGELKDDIGYLRRGVRRTLAVTLRAQMKDTSPEAIRDLVAKAFGEGEGRHALD